MLNKIILMGRLGQDPEVRYTQSGTPVASFSLAVDRDFVDQATGRRPTDWIEVAAWNAKAKLSSNIFARASWLWWRVGSRSGTGRIKRVPSAALPR